MRHIGQKFTFVTRTKLQLLIILFQLSSCIFGNRLLILQLPVQVHQFTGVILQFFRLYLKLL
ncbi:hypothetical protein D3C76_1426710 [compost metagenome]